MKDKVQQQLTKLHNTLEKEFKELSELRNELIKVQQFEMANDIFRMEDKVHNLQADVCRNLYDLKNEPRVNSHSILRDNVD